MHHRAESRLCRLVLCHAALAFGIALTIASCGDDTTAACDAADTATGCAAGQQCLVGADGSSACFCDAEADTGCTAGQTCLLDENGDPACYCNTETEAGCADGLVCEVVIDGYPDCFEPVTMLGMVFDLATDEGIEGALVV